MFAIDLCRDNVLSPRRSPVIAGISAISAPCLKRGGITREGRWHLSLEIDEKEYFRILQNIPEYLEGFVVGDRVVNAQNNQQIRYVFSAIESLRMHGAHYSAIVQTYSNLNMKATLGQTGHKTGADLICKAILLNMVARSEARPPCQRM
ncbi:MAG: hypothetical protein GDA40_08855 [Rhodobacteraceae bacterium]|nr:hypothetical protein [Paracoccaceae bacterium]